MKFRGNRGTRMKILFERLSEEGKEFPEQGFPLEYSRVDDVDMWEFSKEDVYILITYREFDNKQLASFEYVDAKGKEIWGQRIVKDNMKTINTTLEHDPEITISMDLPYPVDLLCAFMGGKEVYRKLKAERDKNKDW